MNTFTKDVERILYEGERFLYLHERILYEGERFLYLHERILFHYFLENFSLGKRGYRANGLMI